MQLPKKVTIVEVCPRDGFQAEAEFIPTASKIALIDALSLTGLRRIEVTSFVHTKAVPQLSDAAEVVCGIKHRKDVRFRVLVPNLIGAQKAIDNGVEEIVFVLSASEAHNQNNVRRTIKESIKEFQSIIKYVQKNKSCTIDATIATAFGCPFAGKTTKEKSIELAKELMDMGAGEIILADTTGMANPVDVMELVEFLRKDIPVSKLAVHFHNTRGIGLANVLSALQCGISTIESSVGGMGGCPFAPGATGNIATEDLVNMLEEMGISTDVDLLNLINCAKMVEQAVRKTLPGQVMKAGRTRDLHPMPKTNLNVTDSAKLKQQL